MKMITRVMVALLIAGSTSSTVLAFGRGAAVAGARVGPGGGVQSGAAVAGTRVGPGGGVQSGAAARSVTTGPYGGVQANNFQATSRTTPGGVTVQRASGSQVTQGPLGGTQASAGSATRVTGPGGQSFTHTQGGTARVGPYGGVSVSGGSTTAVRNPYGGGAAVSHAGGVAVGPYGGVQTRSASAAAVATPYGAAAVGTRTNVAVTPYGTRVGHTTTYMSPNSVRASAAIARGGLPNAYFTPNWYTVHRTAWVAPNYVVGYSYWRPVAWAATAAFIGITASPIVYDYGATTVIQNNNVYINGQQVATAPEYAAQAAQIADAGRVAQPAENDQWQPLGVFGLIQDGEKMAQRIFQLAVNKDGIVRGNYYDAVADNNLPVLGSVDKQTQRVAWSIGDKKDIVFETGLDNFTKQDSTVLVHFGKDSTQQMILVRLEEPKDGK